MSRLSSLKRRGFTVGACAVSVACLCGGALAPTAGADTSSGGGSTVCNDLGLPAQTTTIGQDGVAHVTVFTCGDTPLIGFTQCQEIGDTVPGVLSLHAFLCIPPQLGTEPTL